jgi:hypothetical protein
MRYRIDELYAWYCAQMERARDFHNASLRFMPHYPEQAAADQKRAAFHYSQARFYRREYLHYTDRGNA